MPGENGVWREEGGLANQMLWPETFGGTCHGKFLFAPSSNTSSCPNTSFPSFLLSPYCSWGRFQDIMWMILLDRYRKTSTLRARKDFPDGWYAWASNVFQMDMSKGARMLSISAPLQENAGSSRQGSAAILLEWSSETTLRSAFSEILNKTAARAQCWLDGDDSDERGEIDGYE